MAIGESCKLPKVVNRDDGISGQSLHGGSGAERIVGELVGREVRGLSPKLNMYIPVSCDFV